jgi:3-deoxy-7-phosphoheptulonate synthase
MSLNTKNLRVTSVETLASPLEIIAATPISEKAQTTVISGRKQLQATLAGFDQRLVIICGPCSIHDPKAALEYAAKLNELRKKYEDRLLIVMRVYFEKPRTTVGWKGLISDPDLDGRNDVTKGLGLARSILLKINEMGMPCATEFLDPIVPQYISDLVSWVAIGARTTESQTHRQMASGLSMPVGFKNATDGSLQVALDAMMAARHQHTFLGIDEDGKTSIVNTAGNPDVHLVLRGGNGKSNYSKADIAYTKALIESHGNRREIMIDCSHGNSNKNFLNQPKVFKEVVEQFAIGEKSILGIMVESNLIEGKQDLAGGKNLIYGQSVTDACVGWASTEDLLLHAHNALGK